MSVDIKNNQCITFRIKLMYYIDANNDKNNELELFEQCELLIQLMTLKNYYSLCVKNVKTSLLFLLYLFSTTGASVVAIT